MRRKFTCSFIEINSERIGKAVGKWPENIAMSHPKALAQSISVEMTAEMLRDQKSWYWDIRQADKTKNRNHMENGNTMKNAVESEAGKGLTMANGIQSTITSEGISRGSMMQSIFQVFKQRHQTHRLSPSHSSPEERYDHQFS
jgi:hypothetical protein